MHLLIDPVIQCLDVTEDTSNNIKIHIQEGYFQFGW